MQFLHLIHSLNPQTGGVLSAVNLLNKALIKDGARSRISDDPNVKIKQSGMGGSSWTLAMAEASEPGSWEIHTLFIRMACWTHGLKNLIPSNI